MRIKYTDYNRGGDIMKHVSIVRYEQEDELEALVNQWIQEHEEEILEIIDISYEQYGDLFTAVLTYEERK